MKRTDKWKNGEKNEDRMNKKKRDGKAIREKEGKKVKM